VRWLVKKERYDEAWESLSWMRADTGMFCGEVLVGMVGWC
jgi:hypothetical protein